MVFFNWATMQMAAKIVYYGPGLCGKTTNLSFIYAKTAPSSRGEMVSLETESDRTLFFDLLPIEVGTIGGFKTRLQLYTVPGQVFYNTTRKLVLKGVDGVVFVADSQRPMREANRESFANLRTNLGELGLDIDGIPLVLQYNKRDLRNILTIDELQSDLNPDGTLPFFEASAINGVGVFETLKGITKITLRKLKGRLAAPQPSVTPAAAPQPIPAPPPARPSTPISAAALARTAEDAVGNVEPAASAVAEAPPAEPSRLEVVPPPSEPSDIEASPPPGVPDGEPGEEVPDTDGEGPAATEPAFSTTAEEYEDEPELLSVDDQIVNEIAEEAARRLSEEALEADTEVQVEFEETSEEPDTLTPSEIKHVKVSNQMDILAELEALRQQATMGTGRSSSFHSSQLDLDSLLAGELARVREIRRKLDQRINSDVFGKMGRVEISVRLQDPEGNTIGELDPVSLEVNDASSLDQLSLQLTFKLESSS